MTRDEEVALRLSILCPGPLGNDTPTVVAVRQMRRLVEESDVPAMLARWETADREAAGLRGARGPWLDATQVLTLWLLAVRAGQPANLNSMAKFLCHTMGSKARLELGVDISEASDRVSRVMAVRERLKRSLNRFAAVFDPYPTDRKNLIVTKDEFARLDALVSEDIKQVRNERLRVMGNALLLATFELLPEDVRQRWRGNLAIDSTFLQAVTTRGNYPSSYFHSLEGRAGWYTKDGDHSVGDGTDVRPASKGYRWGYMATTAVMTTNDPDREVTFPLLTLGFSFHQPSKTPGLHATQAVSAIFEAGLPAGYIAGDQAFGSTPKPQDFQAEVRAMGYELLYIPKDTWRGKVVKQDGVPIVDGTAYCPAIESQRALVEATRARGKDEDEEGDAEARATEDLDEETTRQRLEQRRPFQLQFNGRQRPDGSRQALCPAMGPNPTVTCPLRSRDVEGETGKTATLRPVTRRMLPLADVRPSVCTNKGGTQLLKGEAWVRHAQAVPYGTPEWAKAYGSPRQTVESSYSVLKKESGAALGQAHRRAPRGFAKAGFFTIVAAVVSNLSKIGSWLQRPATPDARGRGPLRVLEVRRRDREGSYGNERSWRKSRPSPDTPVAPPPRPPAQEPAA